MVKFSPSLLASDFSNLRSEIEKVKEAEYLHIDIMDGAFVPNISFGPVVIKSIRPHSQHIFDTHLMIEKPERYIQEFAEAGSDIITIHAEATLHLHRVIQKVKENGCQVGVALNPATPLEVILHVLPDIDLVLIMSVNPGFGGQKFISQIINKISDLKQILSQNNPEVKIEVDGGINLSNCKQVVTAGTDIVVAGSAIFKQQDPGQTLREFKKRIND